MSMPKKNCQNLTQIFHHQRHGLLPKLALVLVLFLNACKPTDLKPDQVGANANVSANNKASNATPAYLADRVNARDYHSFWLWGNVSPKPYLSQSAQLTELYILQGEVRQSKTSAKNILPNTSVSEAGQSRGNSSLIQSETRSTLENQGMGLCHLPSAKIWLVYRTTTLDWDPRVMQHIVARLKSWDNYDNQVVGLQIDFDSATAELTQYAKFLKNIRQQLPQTYRLSATGLMDWVNADPKSIMHLRLALDEVIIQTYQGKQTVANYRAYLPHLANLTLPFKVGLVQHGQWQPYRPIEQNKHFKGYVVFLLRAPSE